MRVGCGKFPALAKQSRSRVLVRCSNSVPVFFLLVFLEAWVGGAWAAPAGTPLWGVYWLPFAFMGFLIALILVAAASPSTVELKDTAAERQNERKAETAFEMFFGYC
jgi:hypothetical protein